MFLFRAAVLLLCLLQSVLSEECIPNKMNPCIATCNGTIFDISKLFDFPYNISGGYIWSPCEGYKCPSNGNGFNCAVRFITTLKWLNLV